ncbi:hypothetical protein AB7C87_19515 [Natrarchaeobius sp. A-rgal3]|uniref:hypothetical protein n=1 Tax=Natrarchaeobius versutus TaxID=1679078 RepID=UPI00350F7DBD
MPSKTDLRPDYVFDAPRSIVTALRTRPSVIALFVGLAVVFVGFAELFEAYRPQFVAVFSQLTPSLFDGRYVFRPRTPLVAAAASTGILALGWAVAFSCATSVYRLSGVDGRSASLLTDLSRGGATSLRAFAFLLAAAGAVGAGLLALVVPGVVLTIRLFVGLPVLVLEDRSVRAAIRESWRATAGHEVGIGLIVAGLGAAAVVLSQVPAVGPAAAFVVVGSAGVAASVLVYDALE